MFRRVAQQLGSCDVDRFAAAHNRACARFNARFDTAGAEPGDGFLALWTEGTSYLLPEFSESFIERVLDKIEQDNAVVVCVVPWWPTKPFWRRIHCTAWEERIERRLTLEPDSLTPHEPHRVHCFFGERFDAYLLAFRTRRM